MRFFFLSLIMLLATLMAPTQALPSSSGVACDISAVIVHALRSATQTTRLQVSAASVAPGGTTTITMTNGAGGFFGFLLYVTSNAQQGVGAHVGKFAGALPAGSQLCTNQANTPAMSTLCHSSSAVKPQSSWTWTAPATAAPGSTYQVTALVAESPNGVPGLFNVAPVTITIAAAAQPQTTTAPTVAPTPAPTTATTTTTAPTTAPTTTTTTTAPTTAPAPAAGTTIQQAFNMVLVRLQAVLNGTGTEAQLRAAIQALMQQIQSAVQTTKKAKGVPAAQANKAVTMVVTKATKNKLKAADAGTRNYFETANANAPTGVMMINLQLGFADAGDAKIFAESLQQAASLDNTIRAQSALTSAGDMTAHLQYDPAGGIDTNGNIIVDPMTLTLVSCPDGTQVSQDMQAIMCPAAATTPQASNGSNSPVSNELLIGVIVGGVVLLLLVVGGLVYYQQTKSKSTSVAPRV